MRHSRLLASSVRTAVDANYSYIIGMLLVFFFFSIEPLTMNESLSYSNIRHRNITYLVVGEEDGREVREGV